MYTPHLVLVSEFGDLGFSYTVGETVYVSHGGAVCRLGNSEKESFFWVWISFRITNWIYTIRYGKPIIKTRVSLHISYIVYVKKFVRWES